MPDAADADATELAMFPLGTVLFPFAPLPLHVFEPRYRELVQHCLDGEPEFGVVLIERGSEVGGGDTRFSVGTVARIVQVAQMPDGRSLLVTVGVRRVRVREWLPDDPYPRALVVALDDVGSGVRPGLVDDVRRALVRVVALRGELGIPSLGDAGVPASLDPADDPNRTSFELAARAGLNPLDAQRLLELDDSDARLETLHALLTDEATVLEHQLGTA
jgi:Lon protease-like protein